MALAWTLLAILLGGLLLLPLVQVLLGIHPPRVRSETTPADIGLDHEPVSFRTEDGVQLAGWHVPATGASQGIVVVGHGYPMDKGDVLPAVAFLADRFDLLLFDHRSFGESEGRITTLGMREAADVRAAIDQAVALAPGQPVAAWGFSLSAATTLLARDDRLAAVVADSPFSELGRLLTDVYSIFGPLKHPLAWETGLWARLLVGAWPASVDVEAAIAETRAPVLLIHGQADRQIPIAHAHRLAEAGGDEVTLRTVAGAGHGATHAVAGETYRETVRSFLEEHTSAAGGSGAG